MAGFPTWDDFRELLTEPIRVAADAFSALMVGWAGVEHGPNGQHTNIHATSVETESLAIIQPIDSTINAITFSRKNVVGNVIEEATIGVTRDSDGTSRMLISADHIDLDGKAAFGANAAFDQEQQIEDALTVLGSLRLLGQSSYTPPPGDAAAFADGPINPLFSYYRATPTGIRTITGIYCDVTGLGARGQVLVTPNDSVFPLRFDANAISGNRKILTDVFLTPGQTVVWTYDTNGLGWRAVAQFGSLMVDQAFTAGDFTGNGAMTWTVQVGDLTNFSYSLSGNVMTVAFSINASSVAGTPDTDLQILIPAGLLASRSIHNMVLAKDNGTRVSAFAHVEVGSTVIGIQLATPGNWAASTNATDINGQITFSVQAP